MNDAAAPAAIEPIRVGTEWQGMRGHAYGLRGPVMIGSVRCSTTAQWKTDALAALMRDEGGLQADVVEQCLAADSMIEAFFALLCALEFAAEAPVTQVGLVLSPEDAEPGSAQWRVAIPSFQPPFTQALIGWLGTGINLCNGTSNPVERKALIASMNTRLDAARSKLLAFVRAGGVNATRIARAAAQLDLPMQFMPRGYVYVGSGANALLFNSTMTEATTALGLALARSKSATASLLAMRGLPVARHKLVKSAEEAVKVANALGYPVVVKPDDRDGGIGVNAGLMNDEQVAQCFAQALAISPNVLVEKHVTGLDYRITVDNGHVVKVIGRRPGGVLGDGQHSVEQLVLLAAATKPALRAAKSILRMDAEAAELLAERGMTAASVPDAGEFIALRRRANMSTGGTSSNAIGEMHPDNARLALRATEALRLDLAGIDLIIPDIAVSWMDCVAAICEVNSQPQISTEFAPTVYLDLLTRMLREPSRLHTVVLLDMAGSDNCDAQVIAAGAELAARGERVLTVRTDGTWLGDERITPLHRGVVASATAAELEKGATAAVLAMTAKQLRQNGAPWLHIDEVHVLNATGAVDTQAPVDTQALNECLAILTPHLRGRLVGAVPS